MKMIIDIWKSFRRLPGWVQIWLAFILAPLNMVSLAFLSEPRGMLIAVLAIVVGMMPNFYIMARERGFSRAMAFSHIVGWTPLIWILWTTIRSDSIVGEYQTYLWALLFINVISLAFDYVDAWRWIKGDRAIA
ncbi:hypothetical protein MWU63_05380 [Pseudohalocynthiibacter sp. F2068]|nr:hypothetical protein [Pseudohalocynthiibacter sp. F2068]